MAINPAETPMPLMPRPMASSSGSCASAASGEAAGRHQRQRGLHPPHAEEIERQPDRQLRQRVAGEEEGGKQPEFRGGQPEFQRDQRRKQPHRRPRRLVGEVQRRQRQDQAGEQHQRASRRVMRIGQWSDSVSRPFGCPAG